MTTTLDGAILVIMGGLVPWVPPGYELVPYRQEPQAPPASSFRDWWKELRGETAPTPSPIQSAVVGLRHNAEGAAIGALLALIDTDLGGLDLAGRIPIDWVAAALFYALSLRDSDKPDGLASDYRAMGQSCTTVATYRTVHRWREARKDIPRNIPQLSGDPIMTAGRCKF